MPVPLPMPNQHSCSIPACAMQIADNDKNLGMICLSEQGSMARAGDNESLLPFSQGGAGPAR